MLGLTLSLLLSSFVTLAWAQCFTNNNETTSILKAHESYRLFTDRRFDFAMDALQAAALIETRENLLFSPHSLYQALTLTYYNAHGETEILLRKVLGIPEGLFKGYTFDLRTAEKLDDIKYRKWQLNSMQNYEYNSSNRLWITDEKKARKCVFDQFGDQLEVMDFRAYPKAARDRIHNWVSNITKGQIKDFLPSDFVTSDTDFVLANALHFKGMWKSPFDKASSQSDIFYDAQNSSVTFMHQTGQFMYDYYDMFNAHILKLPYEGDDISMFILLPELEIDPEESPASPQNSTIGDDRIRELIESIAGSQAGKQELRKILNGAIFPARVNVSIPRFFIKKDLSVKSLLQALGASELFLPNKADFRALFDDGVTNIHLRDAVHRTRITVNEAGSTADAAAVASPNSTPSSDELVFIANHPFIYLIYDTRNWDILYSGIYRSPIGTEESVA